MYTFYFHMISMDKDHTYYNRIIKKQKEEENTDPNGVLINQNHMIKKVIKIR